MKTPDKSIQSDPNVPKPDKRRGGGKPYRSKLEPFFEEIRAARKAKKTWAEIAEQLNPRVETTAQGVFYFFKSRRRKKYALGMEPEEPDQPAPNVPSAGPSKPAAPTAAREERPDYEVPPPPADGLTPFQRERRKRLQQEEQAQKNNQPK